MNKKKRPRRVLTERLLNVTNTEINLLNREGIENKRAYLINQIATYLMFLSESQDDANDFMADIKNRTDYLIAINRAQRS